MNFLSDLTAKPIALTPVDSQDIKDRSQANLTDKIKDNLDDEAKHWDAFFQSSCSSWFEHIKPFTFSSTFCSLMHEEAQVIVDHWDQLRELRLSLVISVATPEEIQQAETQLYLKASGKLQHLKERLEKAIAVETALSPVGKAFVKLTTRSPKDSKKAFQRAADKSQQRYAMEPSTCDDASDDAMSANNRWRILCEEVADACAVSNANDAIELLLDSDRVYEDLEFALRGNPVTQQTDKKIYAEDSGDNQVNFDERLGLVARSWDPRLKPESEFRGICQDGQLTCLCQYFHPLLFPKLSEKANKIESDIFAMFQKPEVAKAVASVGNNCIIDFAWLGPGEVVIIELNPFDGVCLGVFPASTGLFLWDKPSDRAIMTGDAPFEFRYRTEVLPKHALLSQCAKDWVNVVYPTIKGTTY